MKPVELTATSVVVPVAFNAPALTTAALTLPVVLIKPLELTATKVVVPVAFNAPVLTTAALKYYQLY
jgi:hypothetical protein